jgi:hypothetical protein
MPMDEFPEKLQEHLVVTLSLIAMCFGFAYYRTDVDILRARIMGEKSIVGDHTRNDGSAAKEAWACTKGVLNPKDQLRDFLTPPASVLLKHFLEGAKGECSASTVSLKWEDPGRNGLSVGHSLTIENKHRLAWKEYGDFRTPLPEEFTLKQIEQKATLVVRPNPEWQETFDFNPYPTARFVDGFGPYSPTIRETNGVGSTVTK